MSVIIVVLLGVSGGLLFKYGTNTLGNISFQRLLEVRFTSRFWLNLGLLSVGIALAFYGGWNLRQDAFAMNYLFSPIVFTALILMFASRFLNGIPLSVTGLGRLTSLTTPLFVVLTTITSVIVFQESLQIRQIMGILLSTLAVFLLSSG
ncbi:MAG: hypothetical protein JSV76_01125 [Candidatus Bathyarchaeota archaeon]|nr:MAG: hypothetical protein JSV76_01125 [Candidatus Bathyarchaeota archaeon]